MIENLLLCVGAQKTGTTWLHKHLKDHPDISFSHVKEVHYFNTIHSGSILLTTRKVEHIKGIIENNRYALEKYFSDLSGKRPVDQGIKNLLSPVDDEWYINLLKKNTRYAADFTPEYALLPQDGFLNIKNVSRNQKVIFIMREPLSRAKSAIQYFFKTHDRNINLASSDEVLEVAKKSFILGMSQYERTIESLDANFDNRDVLYLFFEDIMSNKQDSINQVTDFLDIDNIYIPEEKLEERVNTSEKYEFSDDVLSYLSQELVPTYEFIIKRFGNIYSRE
ncbi:sulfotransferase domain-containing protein [Vibrio sp. 10N.261.52.F3]|uniref:sulfotransferase domain-containing protein n=1 Tax=Vibrio sp. 10N.261.52.F3 TaxID=3229683 RepID=UPI00354FFF43